MDIQQVVSPSNKFPINIGTPCHVIVSYQLEYSGILNVRNNVQRIYNMKTGNEFQLLNVAFDKAITQITLVVMSSTSLACH